MGATLSGFLTINEFRSEFSGRKPHFEYWFGKAVQKSIPTWLHSLLQVIMGEFLDRAGYIAGAELELRIDPGWNPVPDIAAADEMEEPYPTKPVSVVVEILSPGDQDADVRLKCHLYAAAGIKKVFVLDPVAERGEEWDEAGQQLTAVDALNLPNGAGIPLAHVWTELARRANGNADARYEAEGKSATAANDFGNGRRVWGRDCKGGRAPCASSV